MGALSVLIVCVTALLGVLAWRAPSLFALLALCCALALTDAGARAALRDFLLELRK